MTTTECTKCQGSGKFFDITNADAVDAGPFANQCPKCRGLGKVTKVVETETGIAWEAMPAWDDTKGLPDWMTD